MAAKQTNVTLSNGRIEVEFPIEHAERILSVQGTAWMLRDACWEYRDGKLFRAKSKEGK